MIAPVMDSMQVPRKAEERVLEAADSESETDSYEQAADGGK